MYDTLAAHGSLLSTELKQLCGEPKTFDACVTRLQMQTYITVADFEYLRDKRGNPYGWGVARYAITENTTGRKRSHRPMARRPRCPAGE